jgi:hypothetical protein
VLSGLPNVADIVYERNWPVFVGAPGFRVLSGLPNVAGIVYERKPVCFSSMG